MRSVHVPHWSAQLDHRSVAGLSVMSARSRIELEVLVPVQQLACTVDDAGPGEAFPHLSGVQKVRVEQPEMSTFELPRELSDRGCFVRSQ